MSREKLPRDLIAGTVALALTTAYVAVLVSVSSDANAAKTSGPAP